MKLGVLTRGQCQQVRLWRNECLETLRTPYPLTEEMQDRFYDDVICNPNSRHRYYAIALNVKQTFIDDRLKDRECERFIGMGGLTKIQWENRIAEISLMIAPEYRKKGYGKEAVFLLLDEAFNRLNLKTVCGEVYTCNPDYEFWAKMNTELHGNSWVALPQRKYWNGRYYNSVYFSFDCKETKLCQ